MRGLIGSKSLSTIAISLVLSTSCYRIPEQIEPKINYAIQDRYLQRLSSPFSPLSNQEKQVPWGVEYQIGLRFAKKLDLYRAITAFERAQILSDGLSEKRKVELEYFILLAYYLGCRYEEVIQTFQNSSLSSVSNEFPPFKDLLIILYDSYLKMGNELRADQMLELIKEVDIELYKTLRLSTALEQADFGILSFIANLPPERGYLSALLCTYQKDKKSQNTATLLNAVLPGSGYLYLGQKQTAVTAFLFNGLFIASSVYFFKNGPVTAGVITASFEAGWYFGGIIGAANQTKCYNERLYEQMATPMMNREGLFPIFQLSYAF